MPNNDWLQLCDDIDDGSFDEGLSEIAKAIASRKDVVQRRAGRRLMRSIKVGDKVKLTNGIVPRYLEGMVGHVERVEEQTAIVKLTRMPTPKGAGRPPTDGYKDKLRVPFENLVKVDGDATELGESDMSADIGNDDELDDDD